MFNLLEKWVNERGSANIMEKRLGLKDDEIAAMHRELSSLLSEHSNLQTQNEQLNTSLNTANQEIERLQKIIDTAAESQGGEKLDEVKENILKALFESNNNASIKQLAQHFQLQESVVDYHIDFLKEQKLIKHGTLRMNHPITYEISKDGRKYVIEIIGI